MTAGLQNYPYWRNVNELVSEIRKSIGDLCILINDLEERQAEGLECEDTLDHMKEIVVDIMGNVNKLMNEFSMMCFENFHYIETDKGGGGSRV